MTAQWLLSTVLAAAIGLALVRSVRALVARDRRVWKRREWEWYLLERDPEWQEAKASHQRGEAP